MSPARKYYGKYRGVVTNNVDPLFTGRMMVQVPAVLGERSVWAMPCVPYAGNGCGTYLLPAPGTGVWIEFEGGDPDRAIWSGCWWEVNQVPGTATAPPAMAPLKIVRSEHGLMLVLDDGALQMMLTDATGSNCVRIEAQGGQVKIKAAVKVVVEAPQIELEANATQPVVRGEALVQYLSQLVAIFNSHVHPGESAGRVPVTPTPPAPAFPPPTPEMLSRKVKTG
jgi:hypothetical protein